MQSQNSDDPPPLFLSVGTEVSAKFKGAFCEAKISRVDKVVKCKVTNKSTGQQTTLNDDFIRSISGEPLGPNDFKIGSIVLILNQGKNSTDDTPQRAVLNKIIDQSSYTVIFNDGDEKTVRRSFIRFKGERHYLNSETLDNAPLNNPEHFLYPIKNNGDMPSSPLPKYARKLSPSLTERTNDTKRTSNNTDEESFDESLYDDAVQTPNSTAKKHQKSIEQHADGGSFHKIHKKVKPSEKRVKKSASDDEGLSSSSGNESDSSCLSTSSDDFPSEVKDRFVAQLYKFMDDRGTSMNRVPTILGADIDLHRFFIIVRRYGGYNKVCKQRAWPDVYKRLQYLPNFPLINAANVIHLKSAYKRYLQPFEDFYRKLGSTMYDLVSRHTSSSTKSKLNDSHRSLQLFKSRYISDGTGSQRKAAMKQQKQKTESTKQATDDVSVKSESPATHKTEQEVTEETKQHLTVTESSNLTLETQVSSPLATASLKSEEQMQQSNDEVTLFSMVRKINENFKKAKKEKEKEKTNSNKPAEPVAVKVEPVVKDESKKSKGSLVSKEVTKMKQSDKPKLARRMSMEKAVKSPKIEKSNPLSSKKESNMDDYDENDNCNEPKSKRKARGSVSISGSEENDGLKKSAKRKKSTSLTNKSLSSNNETNDETDEDKESSSQGRPASASRSCSTGCDTSSAQNDADLSEKDCKTTAITLQDLEIDRVVDVKYAYTSKVYNYKAKILQINHSDKKILVHYLGWNSRHDEWVKLNRILRVLSEDYNSSNKRRRKSSKTKVKEESISPALTPDAPSSAPKSSQSHKSISLLKAMSKVTPLERSLSCTSTCSSDQSKEESSDASDKIKTKTAEAIKIEAVLPLFDIRNSDSPASSLASSTYSFNSKLEPETESTKSLNSSQNTQSTNETFPSKLEETKQDQSDAINPTPLLSIKEEIIETDQNEIELEISSKTDEINASFSSVDDSSPKKSPKKGPNSSRNNSLTEIRKSSRKNSLVDISPSSEFRKVDEQQLVNSEVQLNTEIEVSFADDETAFTSTNSTLSAFNTEIHTETSELDGVNRFKVSWENICSITKAPSQAPIEKLTITNNVDDVNKGEAINEVVANEISHVTCDSTEIKDKDSNESDRKEEPFNAVQQPLVSVQELKEKLIVNKENDVEHDEDNKKKNTEQALKQLPITNNSINEEKVLSISKTNENTNNKGHKDLPLTTNNTSFNLNEVTLIGKQRIRYIEEQMKLCRESYAKLKIEIAAIDRKKKKLKRGYMDKSANGSYFIGNSTTSNEENSTKHDISVSNKK